MQSKRAQSASDKSGWPSTCRNILRVRIIYIMLNWIWVASASSVSSALASSTFLIATTLASLLFFTNREAVPRSFSDASSSLPSRS